MNLYVWIDDDEHPYFFFPDIGREYEQILEEADDFDREVAQLGSSEKFMRFLEKRSREKGVSFRSSNSPMSSIQKMPNELRILVAQGRDKILEQAAERDGHSCHGPCKKRTTRATQVRRLAADR